MKYITTTLSLALLLALSLLVFEISETEASNPTDLPFVKNMDFRKFMGVWYNIASLPNVIEKNCKCAQTIDTLQSELVIDLSESCLIYGRNITSKSKAVATVPGYGNWTNWNGPLSADYWIVNLCPNYNWAILGQPSRKGFWIISRTPTMDSAKLEQLIQWGWQQGFNLTKLEKEDQSCFTEAGQVFVQSS